MSTQSPSRISLHLRGLTSDALGYDRYRRVYHSVRRAAAHYAFGEHRLAADYEDHVRVGYVIDLPNIATADAVLLAYKAALAGHPMPWVVS